MFFHEHEIGLALADAILLWAVVESRHWSFTDNTIRGVADVAHLAWLTFAAFLNVGSGG